MTAAAKPGYTPAMKRILALFIASSSAAASFAAPPIHWDAGADVMSQVRVALPQASVPLAAVERRYRSRAGATLLIDATEIGVGKFHRYDNKLHPYPATSVWKGHISPEGTLHTPLVFDDADGFTTIQFSNLEELLRAIAAISAKRGAKVAVLNIHGHGLPGGMWYPKDTAQERSAECAAWRQSASGPEESNYEQYYSAVSKEEIMSIRRMSDAPGHYACTTGADDWKEIVARVPAIRGVFADDAVIHFQSCVVGLGEAGRQFATDVASLLLPGDKGSLQASVDFGLGDWSMPEGMGFWDYQNDRQLARDNRVYPVDRKDREIMQMGTIRVARKSGGTWSTALVGGQQFMSGVKGSAPQAATTKESLAFDIEGTHRGFKLAPGAPDGFPASFSQIKPPPGAAMILAVPAPPTGLIRIPGTRCYTQRID